MFKLLIPSLLLFVAACSAPPPEIIIITTKPQIITTTPKSTTQPTNTPKPTNISPTTVPTITLQPTTETVCSLVSNGITIRQGPGTHFKSIGRVNAAQCIQVNGITQTNQWLQLTQNQGYVCANYFEPTQNLTQLNHSLSPCPPITYPTPTKISQSNHSSKSCAPTNYDPLSDTGCWVFTGYWITCGTESYWTNNPTCSQKITIQNCSTQPCWIEW